MICTKIINITNKYEFILTVIYKLRTTASRASYASIRVNVCHVVFILLVILALENLCLRK